jgi:hypothetical protein
MQAFRTLHLLLSVAGTVVLAGGCGGSGGSQVSGGADGGGGHATPGTVGALVPTIEALSVNVNRDDGFNGLARSDLWTVDVATGAVRLNAGVPVTATAAQIQDLVGAVASSAYRSIGSCVTAAVDGGAYPPLITVSGGGATHEFGVSGGTCASSDHSYSGDVLHCAAFGAIYDLLEAIAPTGVAFNCEFYW